jgi:peptidylprolyl isomerase
MKNAKEGDKVKVHYTGKLKDGSVFDSSVERDQPLEFTLGKGEVIAGFETAVQGMQVGDTKTTDIPAVNAYGERRDDMVFEVPNNNVPENLNPQVGQQLAVKQNDGSTMPVTVTEIKKESIIIDANHPLAGKDLVFDIELVEIA